ncbi:hypothetical protein DFJ73DRAFT_765308 [Zopfochytrium polystomum]|nr:hypothetical protein DFJ73DRAFT_765308 [Zopfochytrium polystomum]
MLQVWSTLSTLTNFAVLAGNALEKALHNSLCPQHTVPSIPFYGSGVTLLILELRPTQGPFTSPAPSFANSTNTTNRQTVELGQERGEFGHTQTRRPSCKHFVGFAKSCGKNDNNQFSQVNK